MEKKYNLELLHSLSRGNKEVIKRLILLFIEESKGSVKELKQAYYNTDFHDFRRLVHKVKPTYSYLGVKAIENDLRLMELLAEFGMQSDELEILLTRVERNTISVVAELQNDHLLN